METREPRLTREQYDQWQTFGPSWSGFRAAWLGKGLHWPPRGTDDDHKTLRGVLFPIVRDRPDDIGQWVTEAPGTDPYAITAYILGRWEAKDRHPLSAAEARHNLTNIMDILTQRGTIVPSPGEAAASGDGHDTGGGGTVPPPSQRLPSRPDDSPHDRRSPCCVAEAVRYLTALGYDPAVEMDRTREGGRA